MKKLTSKEPISLRVDGDTLLEITPEGIITHDSAAAVAKERLGDHVTVEDASVESAVQDAQAQLSDLKVSDLKAKAAELGLDTSGIKADLIARIEEYQKAAPAAPAVQDAQAPADTTENAPS